MGLDIFFEKRKRDYDFSNRNNLIKKQREVDNQICELLKGNPRPNTILGIASLISDGEIETAKKTYDLSDVELAEKLAPIQREYNELHDKIIASDPRTEIAYFRKVNFLMTYFSYEGNCEYKLIEKGEVEGLIDRCKKVLDNHKLADELLPTTSGFFFGDTNYDQWYFHDVENVRRAFEGMLENVDWETEAVEMYCWW
jgi:hypothetical protein